MLDRDFSWQMSSFLPHNVALLLTLVLAATLVRARRHEGAACVPVRAGWAVVSCVTVSVLSSCLAWPGPDGREWLRVLTYCVPFAAVLLASTVWCVKTAGRWSLFALGLGIDLCALALLLIYALAQEA